MLMPNHVARACNDMAMQTQYTWSGCYILIWRLKHGWVLAVSQAPKSADQCTFGACPQWLKTETVRFVVGWLGLFA